MERVYGRSYLKPNVYTFVYMHSTQKGIYCATTFFFIISSYLIQTFKNILNQKFTKEIRSNLILNSSSILSIIILISQSIYTLTLYLQLYIFPFFLKVIINFIFRLYQSVHKLKHKFNMCILSQ